MKNDAEFLNIVNGDGQDNTDNPSDTTFTYHRLTDIKRVFCLSDLHTDHNDNMQWLEDNVAASDLSLNDLVIVAGDISHEFSTLEESLKVIREKCQVFFVPGNHEAWIDKREDDFDSLEKLRLVEQICRNYGCFVDPVFVEGISPLWIVPLQSWYDGSLTFDEELCEGFHIWPWVDFARCVWPQNQFPLEGLTSPNARIPKGLAQYYLSCNEKLLNGVKSNIINYEKKSDESTRPAYLITVSHFLPNQQCLPDWKNLEAPTFDINSWLDHGAGGMSAKFAKVAGTALLDKQLRNIFTDSQEANVRQIHVFGHSHRPKDFDYKGIRYIHHPLGKPRERELFMVSPDVNFKLIWDSEEIGEVRSKQIIRLWEEDGGGADALHERMESVRPGRYSQVNKN